MAEPTLAKPELVLFDMDGLMLDTERLSRRSWREAIARAGRPMPDSLFRQMMGTNLASIERLLIQVYGPDFPLRQVESERYRAADEYIRAHGVPFMPGLYDLLDVLDRLKLRRAVCTSTERSRALYLLDGARVLKRFEFVVAGDEVRRSKPMPDIFLRGAARADVEPSRCAVLEDSEAGILAAFRAGMMPLMVPDLAEPSPQTEKLLAGKLKNLHEAARLFERWTEQGGADRR